MYNYIFNANLPLRPTKFCKKKYKFCSKGDIILCIDSYIEVDLYDKYDNYITMILFTNIEELSKIFYVKTEIFCSKNFV